MELDLLPQQIWCHPDLTSEDESYEFKIIVPQPRSIIDFYWNSGQTPTGDTLNEVLHHWTAEDLSRCSIETLHYLVPTPENRAHFPWQSCVVVDEEVFGAFRNSSTLREGFLSVMKRYVELYGYRTITMEGADMNKLNYVVSPFRCDESPSCMQALTDQTKVSVLLYENHLN